MRRFGLVDDVAYAKALVETLHRKGKGRRAIRAKLRERMVPAALGTAAIEAMEAGTADPELEAAMNYARRRRIGPFHRDAARRQERRQKDLAALARQGFGYGVARQVIEAELDDD